MYNIRSYAKKRKMDHVVYLDARAKELEKLLDGRKTMIIRGAAGRKLPYGKVNKGIFYTLSIITLMAR